MTEEQLNQALRLTITELTTKLAEEVTTKQMIALQLVESQEANQMLCSQKAGLEVVLDGLTKPEQEGEAHESNI